MFSVTGFSQDLWVIVLIFISSKCSIAEITSKDFAHWCGIVHFCKKQGQYFEIPLQLQVAFET